MAASIANVRRSVATILNRGETTWLMRKLHRTYISGNRNILKLNDRGIFQNVFPEDRTPELHKKLMGQPQCFYCGFDPTADSLHIGNLLALTALLHCQRGGHQVIALLGGATAQIGDPSGRSTERSAMNLDTIQSNVESIQQNLNKIFNNHLLLFSKGCAQEIKQPLILNNAEWYSQGNVIEFLSTVGRRFRMGTMLGRHSVESRLQSPDGMSLAEFTYQVFQAYDWLHLYRNHDCTVQIGGNDQMGNIMSGQDLISRVTNKHVYGLTVPLVTSATGDKLGKTAGNAVWLHPDKTSPFEFYQHFVRTTDADAERYLKMFTFLSDKDIDDINVRHKKQPEKWIAQKKLAKNVTLLVHGKQGLESAERCTDALYYGSVERLAQLSDQDLETLYKNAPTTNMQLERGDGLLDVLMRAGCFGREVDAERVIKAGGVKVNHQTVADPELTIRPDEHILANGVMLVRVGKKNYYILKWSMC